MALFARTGRQDVDELTGLNTRETFLRKVDARLAAEDAEPLLALFVINLDEFKQLNDVLGHALGDLVLQSVARRLETELGPYDIAARLEGDTFAVATTELLSAAGLRSLAWQVRDSVVQPTRLEGSTYLVGASVGASVAPHHGATALVLLRGAAAAMADAKASQSGVSVYEPGTPDGALALERAADLLIAIESEKTSLVFQPQFSTDGEQVVALEALARWTTDDGTTVSPAIFFPIAERLGLVRKLTLVTMRQALAAAALWRDSGVPVPVCVNLSTPVLSDPTLPAQVEQMLQRHRLPASTLVIELTEAAAVANRGAVMNVLSQLRDAGVRIDLDDFGDGHASFSAVRELPLDGLKVDRKLVSEHDGKGGKFLEAVIELAHSLDLLVVAEGIEDQDTWDAVQVLGVDAVQGYHLAPPLPADQVVAMLRAQAGLAAPLPAVIEPTDGAAVGAEVVPVTPAG